MTNKEKVIIYINEKNQRNSQMQRKKLEDYCARKNYEVIDCYFEGVGERLCKEISNPIALEFYIKNFRLLDALKKRKVNTILILKMSVFGNSSKEITSKLDVIKKKQKVLEVVESQIGLKIWFFDLKEKILDFIIPILFPKLKILYRKGESVQVLDCHYFTSINKEEN